MKKMLTNLCMLVMAVGAMVIPSTSHAVITIPTYEIPVAEAVTAATAQVTSITEGWLPVAIAVALLFMGWRLWKRWAK